MLLVVVVKLSYLASNLADLPSLEAVASVEHLTILLLKLPQLGVRVERATEICLPLAIPLSVLRQISSKKKKNNYYHIAISKSLITRRRR